jgi:hypothetical protein
MDFFSMLIIVAIIIVVFIFNKPLGITFVGLGLTSFFFPQLVMGVIAIAVIGGLLYLMAAGGGSAD